MNQNMSFTQWLTFRRTVALFFVIHTPIDLKVRYEVTLTASAG